jgi:hypothetical protein
VFCVVFCRSLFVLLSFGNCSVCPNIYIFSLPLWYLQTSYFSSLSCFILVIVLPEILFTSSHYLFGIFKLHIFRLCPVFFWSLSCLKYYLHHLITSLVSSNFLFFIFVLFSVGHCLAWNTIYIISLPLWYL